MNAKPTFRAPIRRLNAFSPELNAQAGAAFDAVWEEVTRDTRWSEQELDVARHELAERIFTLAQRGVDDGETLRAEGRKLFKL